LGISAIGLYEMR